MASYKKVSSNGSINIPVAMRRELGIAPRDPMEVTEAGGEIRIRPYITRCSYCGTDEDVRKLHGRGICHSCARELLELLEKGEARHGGTETEDQRPACG